MAAKTFSITANGTATGQQLDYASTSILVSGFTGGGILTLEASHNNSTYATVLTVEPGNTRIETDRVLTCPLPGGWYVRTKLASATGTPAITVAVE